MKFVFLRGALIHHLTRLLAYSVGYANEVGESFKAFIPKSAYLLSYAVSSGYVCADTYDKGLKAYEVWRDCSSTVLCVSQTSLSKGWIAKAEMHSPPLSIQVMPEDVLKRCRKHVLHLSMTQYEVVDEEPICEQV